MTRACVVLRPEPGNSRTAARLRAFGLRVIQAPLFGVVPLAWTPPDPAEFDALLLTSANAARNAGAGLARLASLPVVTVGAATAAVAREAGLTVAARGEGDAAAAIALARGAGFARLLHLAGRDRVANDDEAVTAIPVYASERLPVALGAATAFEEQVVLVHSARAARYLGELVARDGGRRERIHLVGLSAAACGAAGEGWASCAAAPGIADALLVALARDRAIDR
jgi:uroporphyrinogen-III synthase